MGMISGFLILVGIVLSLGMDNLLINAVGVALVGAGAFTLGEIE